MQGGGPGHVPAAPGRHRQPVLRDGQPRVPGTDGLRRHKAYIEAFTKGLAAEYAKKGVRCNCVAPGSIDSGSLQKLLITTGSDTLKDINASARFGTPEDVAAAVAFLCSDESRYINGAVLHVDGGYWLGL